MSAALEVAISVCAIRRKYRRGGGPAPPEDDPAYVAHLLDLADEALSHGLVSLAKADLCALVDTLHDRGLSLADGIGEALTAPLLEALRAREEER